MQSLLLPPRVLKQCRRNLWNAAARAADEGRILTTMVGSMPREPALQTMLKAKRDSVTSFDHQSFDALVASSVEEVVKRQLAVGLDSVCDGELANGSFDDRGDFGDVTMLQSCTTAFDAAKKPSKSLIAKRLRQQNRMIE